MLGLFKRGKNEADQPVGDPVHLDWARSRKGRFFNLLTLDTVSEDLRGKGGVYIIWHGGVKPDWLYVGFADDLARQIDPLIDDPRFEDYYVRGGLWITWVVVDDEFRHGIVRYLTESLTPTIKNPEAQSLCKGANRVVPIAVFPPGKSA